MDIEGVEAFEHRDRHHEVAPGVANKAFDLALVVAFARPTEPVLEQIVRLQLAEHARALPLAIAENTGYRDLAVVVQDRPRHPAKKAKGANVPVAEGFRRLRRIGRHKTRV